MAKETAVFGWVVFAQWGFSGWAMTDVAALFSLSLAFNLMERFVYRIVGEKGCCLFGGTQ